MAEQPCHGTAKAPVIVGEPEVAKCPTTVVRSLGGPGRIFWRTRMDASDEAHSGVSEAHGVFFQSISDRGGIAMRINPRIAASLTRTLECHARSALVMMGRRHDERRTPAAR
jgi:hypothetical protein